MAEKEMKNLSELVGNNTIDWSTKTGIQTVTLSCDTLDEGMYYGSYRYTKHIKKDGTEIPVDIMLNLQTNPRQVVEGFNFRTQKGSLVFKKGIRKGEPTTWLLNFSDSGDRAIYFFLANHPQTKVEGWENPCLVKEVFTLSVRTEVAAVQIDSIRERTGVATSILAMTYEQCKDLMWYLGYAPQIKPQVPMSHTECQIHLLGEHLDGPIFKHLTKFQLYWNTSNTEDRNMRVALRKAERMKVITHANGVYSTAEGAILASDEQGVIARFIDDPSLYTMIKEKIAKIESRNIVTGTELEDKDVVQQIGERRRGRPSSQR